MCFSVEVNLKTPSSLSDAVINTHTAVLLLSDDVILSAAVLLLLERGGKLGLGADVVIYIFSYHYMRVF